LGMVLAFGLWWWYFDGAGGASERPVRSAIQARRFRIWSLSHPPLYLGVAVSAIGVKHIISLHAGDRLEAGQAWILCGAVAVAMSALTTIAATREAARRGSGRGQAFIARYAM